MNDEELYGIAQALESHLPGWSLGWDPVNRPRYADECLSFAFTNSDGAGMYVELSRRTSPARLVVSGRYFPSFYPEPKDRPRITVSSTRSIEAIAADIQRRFIPRYLEAFAQVCKRKRRAEEYERQKEAILAELAEVLGQPVSGDGVIRYHCDRDGRYIYGRIEVSGEQVRLDFSGVPVDTARAICRLLREIK